MEKIKFILGDKDHDKEIRAYFVGIGCKDADFHNYVFSETAYFVNPDTGCVGYLETDEWLFKALVEAGVFEELKYPYMESEPQSKPKLQVIKGVYNRGSEVIELLKSLGGDNVRKFNGCDSWSYYYIDDEKEISRKTVSRDFFKDYDLEILTLPKVESETKQEVENPAESSEESCMVLYFNNEPMILEPFVTKVLVRNDKCGRWIAGIYVNTIDYDGRPYVNIVGSAIDYTECILYQGNEHLAYTSNSPK